ncbi:ABC-type multidrug transport system, ATPase component [Thioflavicoccus mobilis 8321]|uniref:ABC-type multidrug transport system, ATPase component n=1 Tax=Thioflavicoccus mobilis 8321 TaxID=765912 RepID=L0H1A0_9GAMM|nr:ATP-binding cassette domain-containing protein [Thioflavicoccus mobilis]AGA91837.1 ABC-type multidrug transport system, ATPase component [Thioflavicoccus mobilis 8321]
MIEVRELSRSYGDLKAVDRVSFEVGHGEIVGLLGHNGAGKTTIMKMLTGYLEPSDGEILIDGLDIAAKRRAIQRRIGYLPENCPLYPEMTVIDYLEYRAALQGVAPAERPVAIREAIARTALETKATQPIATLSRGFRQRVGVAQAILHHPALLILDEPTNGLDPSQIEHMRSLIADLAETATLLISTHILQEVEAVCDRVLILRAGHLALDAPLADLRATRRLLVTLDRPPAEAAERLGALAGVSACAPLGDGGGAGRWRYLLETADPDVTAPLVARSVAEADWSLYGLQREGQNLESLFREVNASPEAAHV